MISAFALLLGACSNLTGIYFDSEGNPYVTSVVEGDTGVKYSTKDVDALRGMYDNRSLEQMQFSRNLRARRLNKPVHEAWAGNPNWDGGDAIVTDLTGYTERQIKELLAEQGGMYYTGRVKTRMWKYNGKYYFTCMAEVIYVRGNGGSLFPVVPAPTAYVHSWQGPNPSVGFYSHGLAEDALIEGPTPLISGLNYEKNYTPNWAKNKIIAVQD